jgi:two-component system, NtrC family, sensor histidine kinase HydH
MMESHHSEQYRGPEHSPPTPPGDPAGVRELVSEILPHMAAGIVVLGADLTIASWNSYAEQLTGYSLQDIHRLGMAQIFEPAEVMQHILYKVQAGIPTLSEYLHLRHVNGQRIPVAVQCSPQRHLGRSDCQVVVTFRQLEPIQERLRRDEHLAMLGRLASALSHEIRNPLNAIFLHVDVLEEELRQPSPDSSAQLAASLADIKTELTRLSDLVQDYLSLARLSALQREAVMLGAAVEDFAAEMQETMESQGVTLHLLDLESLGEVRLHQNAFRRVLLNLVQNAIEAMPQGGTITIRGRQDNTWVYLEFQDTGLGIPHEQFPLLFTPFHSTKPGGTGLGLYVVQQVVVAHEGEITITSEPRRGTTFTIALPLAAPITSSQV